MPPGGPAGAAGLHHPRPGIPRAGGMRLVHALCYRPVPGTRRLGRRTHPASRIDLPATAAGLPPPLGSAARARGTAVDPYRRSAPVPVRCGSVSRGSADWRHATHMRDLRDSGAARCGAGVIRICVLGVVITCPDATMRVMDCDGGKL